ncbi:hypothetical protein ACT4R9_11695 [Ornithobacterium rhinotracheale]|uniref:hypothetical protein n=1 Tax=Ornithobacterium rhinotracheale TaxID=28251 RepID=UPI003FA40975
MTYAQSKEAKKEIRKYYTEKQIKYIESRLNINVSDCYQLLYLRNSLNVDLFKSREQMLAYDLFFLSPMQKELCTKGEILGFWNNITHLVEGE